MPEPTTTRKFGFLFITSVMDAVYGKSLNGEAFPAYSHAPTLPPPRPPPPRRPVFAAAVDAGNCRDRYSSLPSTFKSVFTYSLNAFSDVLAGPASGSGP